MGFSDPETQKDKYDKRNFFHDVVLSCIAKFMPVNET
jgi:hypothetical protein